MRSLVILAVVAAVAIALYALSPYLADVVTGGGGDADGPDELKRGADDADRRVGS
jgi:hypothetical protein